jgi:hypothetical protein
MFPGPALAACALVVGLVASGIGDARAQATDACKLIGAAEVEAATKVKVGEVLASPKPAGYELARCEYRHADTKNHGTAIVAAVGIVRPEKVVSQRKVWGEMMKTRPIPGVGEAAFLQEVGWALFAVDGTKAVTVQVLDGAAREDAVRQLARLALSKL